MLHLVRWQGCVQEGLDPNITTQMSRAPKWLKEGNAYSMDPDPRVLVYYRCRIIYRYQDYRLMWWVWSRPPQYWHEYRCYNINTQRRPRSKCLQNRVFQLKFGILSANIFTYFTEIRNLVSQYLHLTCLLIKMSELIHPSSTTHHICIWCWMKTCKIAIFHNTQNKP